MAEEMADAELDFFDDDWVVSDTTLPASPPLSLSISLRSSLSSEDDESPQFCMCCGTHQSPITCSYCDDCWVAWAAPQEVLVVGNPLTILIMKSKRCEQNEHGSSSSLSFHHHLHITFMLSTFILSTFQIYLSLLAGPAFFALRIQIHYPCFQVWLPFALCMFLSCSTLHQISLQPFLNSYKKQKHYARP